MFCEDFVTPKCRKSISNGTCINGQVEIDENKHFPLILFLLNFQNNYHFNCHALRILS